MEAVVTPGVVVTVVVVVVTVVDSVSVVLVVVADSGFHVPWHVSSQFDFD